ncbi:hypothetical protein IQ215_00855 [Cyanobacterium stanieri LEGE 03274]|uniref:Uncharacterized protein n=1 Tax=Cyanobacterium stanieri LEGE 03274 TaxID=1828756 RepID=A0ABR9V0Y3_9CHRO|nr:hypothetical protein [Cyanobacterium stanieri]MBE9221236.1 hypothetical protein [Cyanobacterium stanieri LEGE 03274]
MIQVSGKVEYRVIALGAWALVTQGGKTYELYNPPQDLKQDGITVEVKGIIRDDVMTISMIGKILEVRSFTIKS